MKTLSKEDILGANDRKVEAVPVPEWGGQVFVSEMSGTDRDEFEASTYKIIKGEVVPVPENATAKLLARCIVDEAGKRMFSTADIDALGKKSKVALDRVVAVARKINGMGGTSVEDSEKN